MSTNALRAADIHARAELCSKPAVDRGQQVIRFQGSSYVVLGIYFARPHGAGFALNGHRELFYILRPISLDGEAGASG